MLSTCYMRRCVQIAQRFVAIAEEERQDLQCCGALNGFSPERGYEHEMPSLPAVPCSLL